MQRKLLVSKHPREGSGHKTKCRLEVNIQMDPGRAKNGINWSSIWLVVGVVARTVMNLQVPQKEGNLGSSATITFSTTAMCH
jgi:hypothetical protein